MLTSDNTSFALSEPVLEPPLAGAEQGRPTGSWHTACQDAPQRPRGRAAGEHGRWRVRLHRPPGPGQVRFRVRARVRRGGPRARAPGRTGCPGAGRCRGCRSRRRRPRSGRRTRGMRAACTRPAPALSCAPAPRAARVRRPGARASVPSPRLPCAEPAARAWPRAHVYGAPGCGCQQGTESQWVAHVQVRPISA